MENKGLALPADRAVAASHTELPWAVATGAPLYIHGNDQWIASAMGVRGPEGEANIAFIVRAVNAFYPLKDAAQKALNFIANTESELGITLDSGEALRAALKLTEASDG